MDECGDDARDEEAKQRGCDGAIDRDANDLRQYRHQQDAADAREADQQSGDERGGGDDPHDVATLYSPREIAGTLCLTFDNMGRAREIGEGRVGRPDALEPGLAIGYPRLLALLDDLGAARHFLHRGLERPASPGARAGTGRRAGTRSACTAGCTRSSRRSTRLRAEQVLYDGTGIAGAAGHCVPQDSARRADCAVRTPSQCCTGASGYRYDSSTDVESDSAGDDPEPGAAGARPGAHSVARRNGGFDPVPAPSGARAHARRARGELAGSASTVGASGATITVVIHAYVSGVDENGSRSCARC